MTKGKEGAASFDAASHQNNYNTTRINRAKAIRLKCLDCCAYQTLEVRLCASLNCPLWRYRMGREERDNLYCRKTKKTPLI